MSKPMIREDWGKKDIDDILHWNYCDLSMHVRGTDELLIAREHSPGFNALNQTSRDATTTPLQNICYYLQ